MFIGLSLKKHEQLKWFFQVLGPKHADHAHRPLLILFEIITLIMGFLHEKELITL